GGFGSNQLEDAASTALPRSGRPICPDEIYLFCPRARSLPMKGHRAPGRPAFGRGLRLLLVGFLIGGIAAVTGCGEANRKFSPSGGKVGSAGSEPPHQSSQRTGDKDKVRADRVLRRPELAGEAAPALPAPAPAAADAKSKSDAGSGKGIALA